MAGQTRVGAVALAAVSGLLAAAGVAQADPIFYGVTSSAGTFAPANLVRFDMGAQTVTVVGTTGLTMDDCDFDASGQLWGISVISGSGFPPPPANERGMQIDISTGATVAMGNFGSSPSMASLAFRGAGTSFSSVNGATGQLTIADLNAGSLSNVGAHGLTNLVTTNPVIEALAYSPGGTLYGIYNAGGNGAGPFGGGFPFDYKLASFNPLTGVGTPIGSIATSSEAFYSLRFDPATGIAYTVDANGGGVYTIDTTTGHGTLLFAGGPNAQRIRGLAIIPSPGAAALLGLGGVLAIRRRRQSGSR
jgi:hypothetical protein